MHGLPAEIVSQLIEKHQADVSMEDIEGQTPLHYAVDSERIELIILFVQRFGIEKCLNGCVATVEESSESILTRAVRL